MVFKRVFAALALLILTCVAATAQSRGGWSEFSAAVVQRESAGKQTVVNPYGYAGLYQMGTAALIDAGYIKQGTQNKTNSAMNDAGVWTGKNGVNSVSQYLQSADVQKNAWETYQARNWSTMNSIGVTAYSGKTMADGTVVTDSGLIFASQFGVGKVQAYLKNGGTCVAGKGTSTNDGNGICVSEYMKRGAGYDVSSFTKKSENLSNFKAQATSYTGNSDGKNAAQQIGSSENTGKSAYDVGCWPCELLQPVATALDAVVARGDEFAAKNGVWISALVAGFAFVWLAGAAQLGLLSSWRRIAALLAGVFVVVTLLTSRGWLWSELGQPIFNAVVAVGGEIAAPGGTCSASATADAGASSFRFNDESSYEIARTIQSSDTLGGAGGAAQSSGASGGATASASTGALSGIVPAARCAIESAIAIPNKLISNMWWAVDQKVGSNSWVGMPNIPTILQFLGFGIVYIAYTGFLAWIYISSIAEAALGIALLSICLPAALLPKSRPMVWIVVKMIAAPAVALAMVGVISTVSAVAITQALSASGVTATDAGLQSVLRAGALPLNAWVTAVGALLVGALLLARARAWADALTAWLGMPSPSTSGVGQQITSITRTTAAYTTQAARVAGVGVGAGVNFVRSRFG